MTARAKKIFEARGECDFSFQVGDAARFRVNAFKQRQQLCVAIRHISMRIPTMEELKLPGAITLLVCFVLYYFVNWKYLSEVWGLS